MSFIPRQKQTTGDSALVCTGCFRAGTFTDDTVTDENCAAATATEFLRNQ